MVGNWTQLAPRLEQRLGMTRPFDPCEVEALWQLCLTEVGLQGKLDLACSLFTPNEVAMLEWMDDVSLMEGHAYGSKINYEIASPLLYDLHKTLKVGPPSGLEGPQDFEFRTNQCWSSQLCLIKKCISHLSFLSCWATETLRGRRSSVQSQAIIRPL